MRANFIQNRGFNIASNYSNYPNKQTPHSKFGEEVRKRSPLPDSKVSYHSHYLEDDGSPESMKLENIKGPNSKINEGASSSIENQSNFPPRKNMKSFRKNQNFLNDQQKSQSSRLQNYKTGYLK